jgi:hypothetical protein
LKSVWILQRTTGEYSDRKEVLLRAYTTKWVAEAALAVIEQWARDAGLHRSLPRSKRRHIDVDWIGDPDGKTIRYTDNDQVYTPCVLDPTLGAEGWISDGVDYRLIECPLQEGP